MPNKIKPNFKRCFYCGKRLSRKNKSFDHKQPKSRGGHNTTANKVLACKDCNCLKGCLTVEEFRAAIAYRKNLLPKVEYKFYGEQNHQ